MLSLVDSEAAADQFVVKVCRGVLDEFDVGFSGNDHADADTAAARRRSMRGGARRWG